ncbi:MAG: CrcB family protein [Thermoleophilia bacterium]
MRGAPIQVSIAAGGAVGAELRLLMAHMWPVRAGHWPWATFIANIAGTALLAFVATRLLERIPPSTHLRPFWGTGVCGALTTFSTLQVEAITLWRDHHHGLAVAYYAGSIAAGLVIAWLATAAVRHPRAHLT